MDSPSKRQARAKLLAEAEKRGVGGDGGRGPDPSDFDSEAGDEADANISRGDLSSPAKVETAGDADGLAERSKDVAVGETEAPLPTDVRVKLRKLEKLEGRYQGGYFYSMSGVAKEKEWVGLLTIWDRSVEELPSCTRARPLDRAV